MHTLTYHITTETIYDDIAFFAEYLSELPDDESLTLYLSRPYPYSPDYLLFLSIFRLWLPQHTLIALVDKQTREEYNELDLTEFCDYVEEML